MVEYLGRNPNWLEPYIEITFSLTGANARYSSTLENRGSMDSGRKCSIVGLAFFGTGMTLAIFHLRGTVLASIERASKWVRGAVISKASGRYQ